MNNIKQVEDFWNNNLCGKQFVGISFPSEEFFIQYTNFRYNKTHHLNSCINWQSAKDKDVLEIGLGIGADAVRWARHAKTYTGVDLTNEAVYATQLHFKYMGLSGNILQDNAENLSLPSRAFDLVYSHGVLHHTTNTLQTFKEINRVLRPGGSFIVMLYSKGSFNYWIRIQFYFRLRLFFEIFKNKIGFKSKANWALHIKNFKKDGWKYLSWKNFPHHCTDGPDCYIANTYYKSEIKKMLVSSGFRVDKMLKAHFPAGGRFKRAEQFVARFIGFHQLVWATKIN